MKNYINNTHKKAGITDIILLCLIMGISACQESLSDVNTNNNQSTSATTSFLLTSGERQVAATYWDDFNLGRFAITNAQYWTQNQYTSDTRYQYRVNPGMWDAYYEALNTLQQIIRQNKNQPGISASNGPNANQIAVAQVLKAWTFQVLTDIWGDVPYSKALKGADNAIPPYDSQQKIYAGLIDTLQSASSALQSNGNIAFTNGDVFFNGNAQKWAEFANSMIMRVAIREADAAPQAAEAAFKKAYQAGAISSTDGDALLPFQSTQPFANPIFVNYVISGRDDWGVTATLIDFMNKNNDPRRGAYAEPAINNSPTKYAGFPYGMKQAAATNYKNQQPWSRPGERVRQATAPAIFMTASETMFNEAEAAQRGWISADPAQLYNKAIMASMKYWDVSEADAQTYINNNPYQPGNWRQNLGRQKWVALYMQGIQGWSVYRRLDFGLLIPPVGGKSGVTFKTDTPVRWRYPAQEHNLNSTHVDSAITGQGFEKDDQGQRLWWDKAAQGK